MNIQRSSSDSRQFYFRDQRRCCRRCLSLTSLKVQTMSDIYVIHTVKHRAEDPFHPIRTLAIGEWITRLTLEEGR